MRLSFWPMFSFNQETPKHEGKKGTTGVPRILGFRSLNRPQNPTETDNFLLLLG